ncbi:hypothetical protein BO94DRAFT_551216 [Aspergillus sclerotioniger CBS 115572]|uniref:Uncharacterized protein n=1 Tax=Aspergillus sclerotioniger CBS 115572 TaxID=1450535 RepID=A0A317V419_9EURO|nr:hypothetical protein BO94DRAFT_551216 [Aspergillus sclerotioniger CBS 115572]PWY67587.1 hypothetical protein BO94DRAFT_551216 [Aspergillus sclerotioniger CBS 115572]
MAITIMGPRLGGDLSTYLACVLITTYGLVASEIGSHWRCPGGPILFIARPPPAILQSGQWSSNHPIDPPEDSDSTVPGATRHRRHTLGPCNHASVIKQLAPSSFGLTPSRMVVVTPAAVTPRDKVNLSTDSNQRGRCG